MADDDRNEQLLMVLAAEEANVNAELTFVDDGAQLLMHLNSRLESKQLPDLILLDLRMPVLDGHRTLRQLQSHPVLWQIPVITFSSSTRGEDRDRSLSSGARWFVSKPSEYSEMVAFINGLPDRAANAEHYEMDIDDGFTFSSDVTLADLEIDIGDLDIDLRDADE